MRGVAREFVRKRPGVYVAVDGAEYLTEAAAADELELSRTTLRDLLAAHARELPRTERPGQRPARLIRRRDLPKYKDFLRRATTTVRGAEDTMVATLVDELLTARAQLERRVQELELRCEDLHAALEDLNASSRLHQEVIGRLNRALSRRES